MGVHIIFIFTSFIVDLSFILASYLAKDEKVWLQILSLRVLKSMGSRIINIFYLSNRLLRETFEPPNTTYIPDKIQFIFWHTLTLNWQPFADTFEKLDSSSHLLWWKCFLNLKIFIFYKPSICLHNSSVDFHFIIIALAVP